LELLNDLYQQVVLTSFGHTRGAALM